MTTWGPTAPERPDGTALAAVRVAGTPLAGVRHSGKSGTSRARTKPEARCTSLPHHTTRGDDNGPLVAGIMGISGHPVGIPSARGPEDPARGHRAQAAGGAALSRLSRRRAMEAAGGVDVDRGPPPGVS